MTYLKVNLYLPSFFKLRKTIFRLYTTDEKNHQFIDVLNLNENSDHCSDGFSKNDNHLTESKSLRFDLHIHWLIYVKELIITLMLACS